MNADAVFADKLDGAEESKQALRLWLRLYSSTAAVEREVRRRLQFSFETTLPRFDLLAALEREPDGLTMGELSRRLLVSSGNVTGLVTRLAGAGLVERRAEHGDRRAQRVTLTAKGRRDFARMAEQHESWIEDLFAGLSGEEKTSLLAQLDRLKRSITDAREEESR